MRASSLRKTLMATAALVLAAVAAASHQASAQTRVSVRSGAWEAFDGVSDNGRQVCGISTSSRDGRRHFGIKYFEGSRSLVVRFMSDAWSLPDDTPVRVSLRFGDAAPWNATAIGGRDLVEARLSGGDNVRRFIGEFGSARSGRIDFEGGKRPWVISLEGSGPVLDAMARCVRRMTAESGGRDGGAQSHAQQEGGRRGSAEPAGRAPGTNATAPAGPRDGTAAPDVRTRRR
jgi:hypothetical protein